MGHPVAHFSVGINVKVCQSQKMENLLIWPILTLTLLVVEEFPTCFCKLDLTSIVTILASIKQVNTPQAISSFYLGVFEHIQNHQSISNTFPFFDVTNGRNVTSFVGQIINLHCAVRNIGDRSVSI